MWPTPMAAVSVGSIGCSLVPMRSPGSDKPLLSSPAAARTPSDVGSPAAGADAADHVAALQRERAAAVRTAMANQLSAQQHGGGGLSGGKMSVMPNMAGGKMSVMPVVSQLA